MEEVRGKGEPLHRNCATFWFLENSRDFISRCMRWGRKIYKYKYILIYNNWIELNVSTASREKNSHHTPRRSSPVLNLNCASNRGWTECYTSLANKEKRNRVNAGWIRHVSTLRWTSDWAITVRRSANLIKIDRCGRPQCPAYIWPSRPEGTPEGTSAEWEVHHVNQVINA